MRTTQRFFLSYILSLALLHAQSSFPPSGGSGGPAGPTVQVSTQPAFQTDTCSGTIGANRLVKASGGAIIAYDGSGPVLGVARASCINLGTTTYAYYGSTDVTAEGSVAAGRLMIPGTTDATTAKDSGTADEALVPEGTPILGYSRAAASGGALVEVTLTGSGRFGKLPPTGVSLSKIWLPIGACQNTTASLNGDTPTSGPAVAACVTGTNTQKGVGAFADASNLSMQWTLALPSDFTSTVDARFVWYTSATSGNVVWQIATICVADDEADDPAFNTASTVTDAAKGTTLEVNEASITTVTITGCAASELMHVKVFRDAAHASDTLAATANLIGVELTTRRTGGGAGGSVGGAPSGSAGGDLTGTYPNPTLTTSGVAAGTYGNSTNAPVVTVDAKGRVTTITTAAITGGTGDILGTPGPGIEITGAGTVGDPKIIKASSVTGRVFLRGTASLSFTSIPARDCAALTLSFPGALLGDATAGVIRPGTLTPAATYTVHAYISAGTNDTDGVATVLVCNETSGAADPTDGLTFGLDISKIP